MGEKKINNRLKQEEDVRKEIIRLLYLLDLERLKLSLSFVSSQADE